MQRDQEALQDQTSSWKENHIWSLCLHIDHATALSSAREYIEFRVCLPCVVWSLETSPAREELIDVGVTVAPTYYHVRSPLSRVPSNKWLKARIRTQISVFPYSSQHPLAFPAGRRKKEGCVQKRNIGSSRQHLLSACYMPGTMLTLSTRDV